MSAAASARWLACLCFLLTVALTWAVSDSYAIITADKRLGGYADTRRRGGCEPPLLSVYPFVRPSSVPAAPHPSVPCPRARAGPASAGRQTRPGPTREGR